MEIKQDPNETNEGPGELTVENVQYWCHHTQDFANTQINKAKKFVEQNCLEYVGEGYFRCGPISGYNSRTYTIKKGDDGEFHCNCQAAKDGGGCSHRLALYYCFKLKYFKNENY